MRQRNSILVMSGISLLLLGLVLPSTTLARPKKPLVNGCTVEQIQSNFGNSCGEQMQQDILNKRSYVHALLCNGGSMQCCTYDTTTDQILNCRQPAGTSLFLPGLQDVPKTGAVQSRGVEGDQEVGEAASIPSWMTEQRLKELSNDYKNLSK